jgi:hypothetical protein
MTPEKERKPPREEFEVEYYTKEVGRRRQRKLLRRRVHEVCDSNVTAASHAEEPSWEDWSPPPREDRAG